MPATHPFLPIRYADGPDQSSLVAPPYDVLSAAGKAALLSRDTRNIVAIDLPHTPPKEPGPPEVYTRAAERLNELLADGTLVTSKSPAMLAYRQTFHGGPRSPRRHRTGMACTVDTRPFGPSPSGDGGILPHEETFSGPRLDRLALMRATRTQLSPIFGLHADERGAAVAVLRRITTARPPDRTATTDDQTLHEVWTVSDASLIAEYQAALATEDIFIADGHHRYTTALTHLAELESRGPVAHDHPARRTMMVLVSMSDPGLVIWPTHRVLGGMKDYSWEKFLDLARRQLLVEPVGSGRGDALDLLAAGLDARADLGPSRTGLFDFASGQAALVAPRCPDPLAARFPEKPRAWRDLAVAFIQHVLVEELGQPLLNGGHPVAWAFPHSLDEVREIGRGVQTGAGGGGAFGATGPQLAVIVRPTPLSAVREVSRAGHLMPQKSTFFYPKLATGLFMHALKP